MTINFASWTEATANLSWGAQNAMYTSLELAAEGKIDLVYGSDYVDGKPCLVNSVGQMLEVGGGQGIPSANFSQVVGQFDSINRALELNDNGKVNEGNQYVSPLAAEILVQNFGPLKAKPVIDDHTPDIVRDEIIAERSDEEFTSSWLQAISTDNAPVETSYGVTPLAKEVAEYENANPWVLDE